MRQILIEIPIPFVGKTLPLYGFGLMMCIGFFAGSWLVQKLARREGLDPQRVADLVLWIFIWGIVGARALFMVRNPDLFRHPLDFFKIWEGGIVFYGGVMTAIPVFILFTRRYGMPPWKVLDVLAPGLALGIAIGRFGCLLNGCCWGVPTQVPWAVQFPAKSIPWHDHVEHNLITRDAIYSLPVHPTQVYLALAGWLLLALILVYFPHRRRYGEAMALLMVGYSITRFGIEFLRGDEPLWADRLTISQNISILLLIGGVFMWGWLRRAPSLRVLPAAAQSS